MWDDGILEGGDVGSALADRGVKVVKRVSKAMEVTPLVVVVVVMLLLLLLLLLPLSLPLSLL